MSGIELTPDMAANILVGHLESGEMDNVPNTMMPHVRNLAMQVSRGENGDPQLWSIVIPNGYDEVRARQFREQFVKAICTPK